MHKLLCTKNMDMVLIVCPHMVLIVCPLYEHARGQPGIATAGCSGGATRVEILCNGGATRVEILAVQRSAMRDRQYRNGRVDLCGIFSPAHTGRLSRAARAVCLRPPSRPMVSPTLKTPNNSSATRRCGASINGRTRSRAREQPKLASSQKSAYSWSLFPL